MLFAASSLHRVCRVVSVMIGCAGSLAFSSFSTFAASSVTVAWSPNANPEIAGYRVYYGGASRVYTNQVDAGRANSAVINGLTAGATYYLAATAYDVAGLESDYSAEAVFTNRAVLPPTIVLSAPANGTVFTAPATLHLAADVAANGHSIVKVQFYNGSVLLGEDATPPYEFAWGNVSEGIYDVKARAIYDLIGLVTSPPVRANVYTPPKPPNTPPILSALADQTLIAGSGPLVVNFQVGDAESAPGKLALAAETSDAKLLPVENIVFDGSGNNRVATLRPVAGRTGAVEVTFMVHDGEAATSASFWLTVIEKKPEPAGIALVSPVGAANMNSTQRYVWRPDPAATRYELEVTRDGRLFCDNWYDAINLPVDPETANVGVEVAGHSNGNYQWRVRGWSAAGLGPWSSAGTFAVATPRPVVLLTPADQTSLQERRPQFSWEQPVPPAEWFHLCINRNGSRCYDLWLEGTTQWTPSVDLPGGAYTWAVQAWSPAGVGPWSKMASFTAQPALPGQIALLTPKSSALRGPTLRYHWSQDSAAVSYELYITRDGAVFYDQWLSVTNLSADPGKGSLSVEVPGHAAGSYYWYVRGWNPDGFGPWSRPGSFSVDGASKPLTLLTPTNNAVLQERRPEFSWMAASPPAAAYHLYLSRSGTNYYDVRVEGKTNWVPSFNLTGGSYTWMVQAWDASGSGASSETASFTSPYIVPAAIVALTPRGTAGDSATQRYQWQVDAAATRYQLYINRDGSVFHDQWYDAAHSVLDPATGKFAVDVPGHSPGTYQWWVRGWGPEGMGTWSDAVTFRQ